MNVVATVVGFVVVIVTVADVILTMVLPRRPSGVERFSLWVNRSVRVCFVLASHVAKTYERQDAILAPTGPVALVVQLLFWAACLVLGFGLILVGAGASFADALLQALTALFTVGAVHIGGQADTGVDIAVGAIWVVIVALQIAYLPALYSSFNRREGLVALLESRAGVPAWGPELLARHQLVGINDTLPDLYAAWEQWAADVAETHTTYPVLLLFRSPEPWYSWLLGLIAVLDAAAMHLALAPSQASSQARLCLRMGFTLLNRIATTIGWEVDLDPNPEGPIELTFAEFERAVVMLEGVGFATERSAEEAWVDFRGWRVNYESVAYRLADRLTVPPAPWSGPRRHMRSGPVEPRRPPQRRPGGGDPFVYDRPPVVIGPRRNLIRRGRAPS
ncbi:MAG TPA: hypothetical protein VGG09_08930 [Acidimicrobiales bacterium]|jgi:hypothetical protein